MKKALLKDSVKEVRNTFKRFLSILLMSFLGVGFFAGIRASSPDMKKTIDSYYHNQSLYDIQIVSTLGLTDDDVDAVKDIKGIKNVYGSYSKDVLLNIGDSEIVVKVHALENDVNTVILKEGSMPKNISECVVEKDFIEFTGKKIGEYIEIEQDAEDINFKESNLKIVGVVESPLYISKDRGTSKLGSGKINYYIYIVKENMNMDVYTEIYATVKGVDSFITGSDNYDNKVETALDKINTIKEDRQIDRYDSLVTEATNKVNDAEKELSDKKKEAENKFIEAENKIADAKKEIDNSRKTLSYNRNKAYSEFKIADESIKTAEKKILDSKLEYESQKQKADTQISQMQTTLKMQNKNLKDVEDNLKLLKNRYNEVLTLLNDVSISPEQKVKLQAEKSSLEASILNLEVNKTTLVKVIADIENGILTANFKLESVLAQINQADLALQSQKKSLEDTKSATYSSLKNADVRINNAEAQLNRNIDELNIQKDNYNKEIKNAEEKLIDARNDISEIEQAKWYVLDRESNSGYNSFMQDADSIANIGKVFPIVFFVIATLISLTSMTRMVEEQRVQIGTLKALGYTNFQIINKYLLYASIATAAGGILGMSLCFYLLPKIVWMMYSMMYSIPNFVIEFNLYYGLVGLGVAFICIVGATFYASIAELKHMPAVLMRPKAPKLGKRVLLERIPFIWNKLNFIKKVTVRNIFRYKKRFLMTIIGISGCTALVLAGFGLKDSISSILFNQYEKVFNYDIMVNLKKGLNSSDIDDLTKELDSKSEVKNIASANLSAGTLVNGENKEDVQIIVPNDINEFKKVIRVKNAKTKQDSTFSNNTIFISDKAAELLKVKKNDKIILKDANDREHELIIGDIVENYISHYVYMSKDMYNSLGEEYNTNALLINNNKLDTKEDDDFCKELMNDSRISSVYKVSTMVDTMNNMMDALNYVVWLLIISSGLLVFVVLYNLSNVNISERIRELSTIKVLGFYDKEVHSYVTRETILLTTIGIIIGLVAGYFLNSFIITTCEINMLRFTKDIKILSYVYSVLITVLFTTIVNIVTYFALKKIDMIESLKSVE